MQGNQACAVGALAAGCRFFAGYPITPSSEIAEYLSVQLPRRGGKFIQMEDEIAAMGATIGASLTGLKAMTATSGPGFSLKQENIGYACMTEVPCVIVNVMRGGPSTGMPTLPAQMDVQQARWGTHGDHEIIVLTASSAQDTYEQTIRAFNLSERYMTPVILLLDEIVGHSTEKVVLPRQSEIEIVNRKQPEMPPQDYLPYKTGPDLIPVLANLGSGYRYNVTGLCHDETGFPTNDTRNNEALIRRLVEKIKAHRDDIVRYRERKLDDAEIVIFAYGSVARSAKSAVVKCREKGIRAGLFEPSVIWPFPVKEVFALSGKVKAFLVPEMNLGQLAREVRGAVEFKVPVHQLNRVDGNPITPLEIVNKVEEVI
ncbi:MAG: 2-oxoacid:acceptor oxidoreductase subunit alpha [Candidatus Krumholzibacteriota bacterium]|nr:2-oxoacid:acceptor oxidoreductase subunit alpha [Candidatus Krumholzibacteriota bacterium]